MSRVLRIEALRGAAPVVLALTLVTGVLFVLSSADNWSGRWGELAQHVRIAVLPWASVTFAAGVWQGGRDARRGLPELLGTTARPRWHRVVLAWLALTLAALASYAVVVGLAAAVVARFASYAGGDWPFLLLVAALSLPAFAALGLVVGARLPGRFVVPVAAVSAYVVLGMLAAAGALSWLSPLISVSPLPGSIYPARLHLVQALWFAGAAVGGLLLAGAARRRLQVAGLAAVVVAALPVLTLPDPERENAAYADAAARRPVCTPDTPRVCTSTVHAFLLDDVAATLRPMLRRLEQAQGAPATAIEYDEQQPAPGEVRFQIVSLRPGSGLSDPGLRAEDVSWSIAPCVLEISEDGARHTQSLGSFGESFVVSAWLSDQPVPAFEEQERVERQVARLRALPEEEQRDRLARYLAAVRGCAPDPAAVLA